MTTKDKLILYGVEETKANEIIENAENLPALDYWLSHECCINVIKTLLGKGYLNDYNAES